MGVIDRTLARWGYVPEPRPEARNINDPTMPVSSHDIMRFFGMGSSSLAPITVDAAMSVPAVLQGVGFLSRMLASLPLPAHLEKVDAAGNKSTVPAERRLQILFNEAPNAEQTSFEFRRLFWQSVFTHGRGLAWIERAPSGPMALWWMDPRQTVVERTADGRKWYKFGTLAPYPATDVIDVPFMLRECGLQARSPIDCAGKAIQLAIAMSDYGADFFSGGGVPPLTMTGPMPAGPDARARAMAEINRSIEEAKAAGGKFFKVPPGYELKPVGIDPDKAQMTDARRFQIEEIARVWGLPPVFLMDLTHGTFTNTEQQDLQLVKHTITHWAVALEQEINLKVFGRQSNRRWVEHNMSAVTRGDFKTRMEALARGVQSGIYKPNEARALENLPADEEDAANELFMQGATVPISMAGMQQAQPAASAPPAETPDQPQTNGDMTDAEQ